MTKSIVGCLCSFFKFSWSLVIGWILRGEDVKAHGPECKLPFGDSSSCNHFQSKCSETFETLFESLGKHSPLKEKGGVLSFPSLDNSYMLTAARRKHKGTKMKVDEWSYKEKYYEKRCSVCLLFVLGDVKTIQLCNSQELTKKTIKTQPHSFSNVISIEQGLIFKHAF